MKIKIKAKDLDKLRKIFPKQDFGLTPRQGRLLALFAYTDGERLSEKTMRDVVGYPKKDDLKQDLNVLLNERNLITLSDDYWSKSYDVRQSFFLRVALDTFLYNQDVVASVERYGIFLPDRLCLVCQLVADDFSDTDYTMRRIGGLNLASLFTDVIFERAFEPLVKRLPSDTYEYITSAKVRVLVANNEVSTESLEQIETFVRTYVPKEKWQKLFAELDGVRFFLDGRVREQTKEAAASSLWPLAVSAVRALYRGEYAAAMDLFEKSLKISNKTAACKGVFTSPVLSYYLVMCYVLVDNEKSRKKLSLVLGKTNVGVWMEDNLRPGMFLGQYATGQSYDDNAILKRTSESPNVTCRILISGIAEQKGLKVPFSDPLSKLSLVRYESGKMIPGDRERLSELLGGTPLLSRLRAKKPWEVALERLNDLIGKSAGTASPEEEKKKERRLVYIVDGYNEVLMRDQALLKSGKWGQGKRVSFNSFVSGAYDDVADEMDRQVQLRVSGRGWFAIGNVFPALVGCDRVFNKTCDPSSRVEIAEEQPYVDVKLKEGKFVFSTNVPKPGYEREYALETVVNHDPLHYRVIRLNRLQSQVLTAISEAGVRFPEDAADAMRDFAEKLSKIIEVHSPLLEGGSSLQEKDGCTVLSFRIIPKSGHFEALLYIRPLENGSLTFYPGRGDAVYYDTNGTSRYQVKRNLKAEKSALIELLAKTGLDEQDSENGMFEIELADMLPILDALRSLGDICSVEWPEGRSLRIIGSLNPQGVSVTLKSKEQWFELEGDAELSDGEKLTLEQLLSAISDGGYSNGYLRLGEDEYVSLSDSLAKYLKRLEGIAQNGRGGERVSLFQTGALADIVRKGGLDIKADKEYREKLAKINESATLNPAVPSALKAELRDYQEEGFRWMARLDHWGAGACLADDMGLGKTVQTIAFLLYKASAGASLVVAPASVLMNWVRELARFAPSLNVIVLNEQDDRADSLSGIGEYDVVLTTYGLLVREKEALTSVDWNVVCLDEAHTIKNRGTKMSDSAMALKASSRVILTGTPVQNYLGELWNLFQFLNPGLLGSYESFSRKFIGPIESSQDKDRQAQLKRIIQPFMLRRTKAEVVEELPEKTEIFRSVPLSGAERMAYETMRLEAKNELEHDSKVNMNALAAITRLREAACAMPLVKKGWSDEPTKIAALRELVSEIVSGGNSVLVFSQFTGFLDLVSEALTKDGVQFFYLQGSTPIKKRQEMVTAFQRGECPVFLISLKAGGLGLNLTGANYVIHLDPWWNPAIEQQATDRAYRIGQQQNVTVYHLVAENTIEDKILRLHKTKQNLADALLEGTSQSHAITLDELRELVI